MNNEAVNDQQVSTNSLNSPEAIKQFAGFFDLLSKIDQRLMKEDQEYRDKYFQEKTNEN